MAYLVMQKHFRKRWKSAKQRGKSTKNLLFIDFNGELFADCRKSVIFAEDKLRLGNLKQVSLRSPCIIFANEIKTNERYDKLYIRMVVALLKIEEVVSYEAV